MPRKHQPEKKREEPPANFLARLKLDHHPEEKKALAQYFSKKVISEENHVFLAVGTTVYRIAEELFSTNRNVSFVTNCVPIAYLFLELARKDRLGSQLKLETLQGKVDQNTSVIEHKAYSPPKNQIFIWTPHGITEKGLKSENHAKVTNDLIGAHKTIYLPMTWNKLGRDGADVVKYLGKMGEEIRRGARTYHVVLPPMPPPKMSDDRREECKSLLIALRNEGIEIVNPPKFLPPPEKK